MIPAIANGGSSFKGAALYYLHDKKASTRERVDWLHVENLPISSDPDKAVKIMAWTAMHQAELKQQAGVKATGRKLEKPVFTFSLSWHPEENPEKEHMLATAKSAVEQLGLSEYQALYVAHNDEPQKHVHVIINRVHPENGKAATLSMSKEKLSQWAHSYEKEHGKVYCQQREEKAHKQEQGSRKEKYCDPVIVQAWEGSDSGKAFVAALQEQGYHLAQGNKRLVVVDQYGKAYNPVRLLEGVKAKDFKAKIQDLDNTSLPKADDLQKQIKEKNWNEYLANRKYDYWASSTLNELQDRHNDERANVHNKYHRLIDTQKQELNEYYKRDELTEEIEQLENTLQKPSLWRRISGQVEQDREHLEALQKNLKNIDTRIAEKVEALENARDQDLQLQNNRHTVEKEHVYELVKSRKPDRYSEEAEQDLDQTLNQKQQPQEKPKQKRGRGRGLGL